MELSCFECGSEIAADDLGSLGDAFVAHARASHDWPYSDRAIRNYSDATQRLTGPTERLDEVGPTDVKQVTSDLIDDWLSFFDHDAFVGTPEWAACYCLEPHVRSPDAPEEEDPAWTENRNDMVSLLGEGVSFGYLAYQNDRPIGWVNASLRSNYRLYGGVDPDGPDATSVIGVSCFIIAPPYRRHSVASILLDRVLDDAGGRGAAWVEAYPFNEAADADSANFRGPMSMFLERGFEVVELRERDTVVRKPVNGRSEAVS
ncbi:MAG TPA: GNAT family N-acetyltransferase [Acidimicrobiia bacterium]